MFLNTGQTSLWSPLSHINEWISDKTSSPTYQIVSTQEPVAPTPLVNLEGVANSAIVQVHFVFNELRRAHMTHQIIARSAFSEKIRCKDQSLGRKFYSLLHHQKIVLVLSIDPACERDTKGERCFEHDGSTEPILKNLDRRIHNDLISTASKTLFSTNRSRETFVNHFFKLATEMLS